MRPRYAKLRRGAAASAATPGARRHQQRQLARSRRTGPGLLPQDAGPRHRDVHRPRRRARRQPAGASARHRPARSTNSSPIAASRSPISSRAPLLHQHRFPAIRRSVRTAVDGYRGFHDAAAGADQDRLRHDRRAVDAGAGASAARLPADQPGSPSNTAGPRRARSLGARPRALLQRSDADATSWSTRPATRCMLIDYEYASNNDRCYELGIWFGEMFFSEAVEARVDRDAISAASIRRCGARCQLHKALADIKWCDLGDGAEEAISTLELRLLQIRRVETHARPLDHARSALGRLSQAGLIHDVFK